VPHQSALEGVFTTRRYKNPRLLLPFLTFISRNVNTQLSLFIYLTVVIGHHRMHPAFKTTTPVIFKTQVCRKRSEVNYIRVTWWHFDQSRSRIVVWSDAMNQVGNSDKRRSRWRAAAAAVVSECSRQQCMR